MLAEAVGITAAVATATKVVPQPVRIVRERTAAGVSTGSYATLTVAFAAWVALGVTADDLLLVTATGFAAAACAATVALSLRHTNAARPPGWWRPAVTLAVICAAAALIGPWWLTAALVGADLVVLTQTWRALNAATSTAGFSVLRWGLDAAVSTCWVAYGTLVGNWWITTASAVWATGCAVTALIGAAKRRPRLPSPT